MALVPPGPSDMCVLKNIEVAKVFGRYPKNMQFKEYNYTLYHALRDLDVLKEHMILEESSEIGASKSLTACYERILSFIDRTLEEGGDLWLDNEDDEQFTIKKYQVEVVLNAVKKNPLLKRLLFMRIDIEDDCWDVIAKILGANSTRMWMTFCDVFRDAERLGLFARSLKVYGGHLTCLDLYVHGLVWDEKVAEYIKLIFEYCPNLEEIYLSGGIMSLDGGRMMGKIVANQKSLTTLGLGCEDEISSVFGMCDLLNATFKADMSLKHLVIDNYILGDNLECLIHAASLLETLELLDCNFGANSNLEFFKSLKDNTKLKHLKLSYSNGIENLGSFEDLIDAICGNMSLVSIDLEDTKWSRDGKASLVYEALDQRVRQRDYLLVLSNELKSVSMKGAVSGRIFLCGQPYGGKSQLAYTMMQEERTFIGKAKNFFKRTKGIEIHALKNDKDMQVVLWDLAGQEIFRALHEHLFPKITTICLYLFVFNPFEYRRDVCSSPKAMEDAFEEELKAWLRFLCTNSNISYGYLPHVVVVITHHDKLSKPKNVVVQEVQDIIEEVSKQFKCLVEISKDYEHIFCVDGRDKKDIQPLLLYLYEHFRRVSTTLVDEVPDVCNEVNRYILKQQAKTSFMTVKDFNDLCKRANKSMNQVREDSVFVAMRKYLHDVGTIIDLAGEDLIITNPNWLTKDFLGKLMSIAHGFESSSSKYPIQLENGYVSLSQLNTLFSYVTKHPKVDVDTLVDKLRRILIGLHLCHKVDKEYFVPILFEASKFELSSKWTARCAEDQFLGLRLSCANNNVTYLTTAVFSRFQVYMHTKSGKIFDKSLIFKNRLNCIRLCVDGYEVLIECDYSKGQHVDVLVKISRTHETSMEDAWTFIWDILEEIRKFYAHPKGAPGVALVSEIIRKECVETPTPCHLREKSQSISISQLKESLEESLKKFPIEHLRFSGPSLLHRHTWPECKEAHLQMRSVPALDLLRGCPDARKLQEKVIEICGKCEEKSLDFKEHEKTRCLIEKFAKAVSEKSTGSMPKLPYFTSEDVGLCRRLGAKLNFSIPMKLHFLCESSQGVHDVLDQKGFEIMVEQKNRELVRFAVQSTAKIIHVLANVAMKATTGVSGDLPFMPLFAGDETKVIFVGGAVTAEKLLNEVKFSEALIGEGSASLEDWPYMKERLEPQLQGQYGALFGLYMIEYIEGHSEVSGGWLCRKCIDKGKKGGIISKVCNVECK